MKKILWLIQSNQITPTIHDFLKLFQTRMERLVDLSFIVPETSSDILERITALEPSCFKLKNRSVAKSYQGYLAKKACLNDVAFTQGLTISDVLLLDDLGGGNVIQTGLDIKKTDNTCGLILQIPTPLGSSEAEERVFHAAIVWARQNRVPVIGYELLPLDTRWTLSTSLPDGVITRYSESYDHLKQTLSHKNIWQLPLYEASIFSSVSATFNLNGVKASYHYRTTHTIPEGRTILFLPHNVAMLYEYQELLRILAPMGKKLHLMFNYGEDQVRGAHTQKEMIEIIYKNELAQFASYSFHNMDSPWEMLTADSLVACSACFQGSIAQEKNIPSIIFDPMLPAMVNGFKQRINTVKRLQAAIKEVIALKTKKTELGTIFMQLAGGVPKK
ncbi:MAG: hypothetical protein KKF12_14325 [Proteobacteria bacterium]|nr:hypothetical protein [Desulfobacula sp.]MBU4131991.1 hypothetical protein [Pseudomonadota bacterium]